MKTVIYDFNGTILDDVDVGIIAVNEMVKRYLDRDIVTKEEYLRVFTFPVIDYYRAIGFDFDKLSFEELGKEWMEVYEANKDKYSLFDGVIEQLVSNKEKGIRNILLSASRIDKLIKQCEELAIKDYFDEILGIDNIYASSKVHIAKDWIKRNSDSKCLFIGDTLHDLEVSKEMGIPCALVARGHQAKDVLLKEYDRVYDDIKEVVNDENWPI